MVPNGSSGKTVSELNLLSTTPWKLSMEKKAPAENRISVLRSFISIIWSYAGSRRKDGFELWRGRNLERRDPKPLANHSFWRQIKTMQQFRNDIGFSDQGVISEVIIMVIYDRNIHLK
jgi:hypothetical protein